MGTTADILVLGGGPGGYLAAERAAQGGKSVILIERGALGGTCLNEGCIPSKVLLNSAKRFRHAKEGEAFGVRAEGVTLDHRKVMERKRQVVNSLVSGVGSLMKASGVQIVAAQGKIRGKDGDRFVVEAEGEDYSADRLILACGSVPVLPPIPGLREAMEKGRAITSREALALEEPPGRLAIIGGGVIGLEMAAYYAAAGAQVTVMEMTDKIAGPMEREVSARLLKAYQKRGIDFRLSCRVTQVGDGVIGYEESGEKKTWEADKILCAVGRRALSEEAGLDKLHIYTERGAVITDEHMQTNVPGVYAVGDINGRSMLAHTAYREAEVAVNHILGRRDFMRYRAVPAVIYTDPEAACVGETPEGAREKGLEVRTLTAPMKRSGRYLAEVEKGDGFCKLVIDTKQNRLIGCHILGSYASEMIFGAALMIDREMPLEHIRELVFPHPTVSEVIREALFMA